MFALLQKDAVERRKFTDAATQLAQSHRCLEQLLIPDARMNGATLRFWDAQHDVLIRTPPNMISSPHGWSAWRIYGAWYLYLLTGEEEWLTQALNALGSCAQVIDAHSGELRWAFVPEPFVPAEVLVPTETPGRGRYVVQVVGENYLPMISGFHFPETEPVWGSAADTGWCCDNDVHEIFKCVEEVALTNGYVIERESGEIVAWNCTVKAGESLTIVPREAVMSRVHLNFKRRHRVDIVFGKGERVSDEFDGMGWVGPGGVPENLHGKRKNYLWLVILIAVVCIAAGIFIRNNSDVLGVSHGQNKEATATGPHAPVPLAAPKAEPKKDEPVIAPVPKALRPRQWPKSPGKAGNQAGQSRLGAQSVAAGPAATRQSGRGPRAKSHPAPPGAAESVPLEGRTCRLMDKSQPSIRLSLLLSFPENKALKQEILVKRDNLKVMVKKTLATKSMDDLVVDSLRNDLKSGLNSVLESGAITDIEFKEFRIEKVE